MQFTIRYLTHCRYSQPVQCKPQRLRFQPRDDGAQRVIHQQLDISPAPPDRNHHLDVVGNRVIRVWFGNATDHLDSEVNMATETLRNTALYL